MGLVVDGVEGRDQIELRRAVEVGGVPELERGVGEARVSASAVPAAMASSEKSQPVKRLFGKAWAMRFMA